MNFFKNNLGSNALWVAHNPKKALIFIGCITLIMFIGIGRISMEMSFYSLMPENDVKFQDLQTIMKEFPFAGNITVVVNASAIEDEEEAKTALIQTMERMSQELSAEEFKPYIKSVYHEMDLDLFKTHGMILLEEDNLRRFTELFKSPGLVPFLKALNNDFEREYSGDEESLREDEGPAQTQFKALESLLSLIEKSASGEKITKEELEETLSLYLYGEGYFFSRDNKRALMFILPTFFIEDLEILVNGVTGVEERVKKIAEEEGIEAGLTGLLTVSRDEMVTSSQGFVVSLFIASILILTLLIFIFKMPSVPVVIGIPLMLGVLWTVGVTGFVVKRLNMMTAMYMIALIGLGVDYAIHLITNFVIDREEGADFDTALYRSFQESGKGIISGAFTTAAAFFALLTSDTGMMKELGLVAGIGILCELLTNLLCIPVMLSFAHKKQSRFLKKVKVKASLARGVGVFVTRKPRIIFFAFLGVSLLLLMKAKDIQLQDNLMEMEAKGLESIRLQDEMVEEFQMSPDAVFLLTSTLDEVKEYTDRLDDLSSVKSADSVAPFLLNEEEKAERIPFIHDLMAALENRSLPEIAAEPLIEEVLRLEMNFLELSDLSFIGNMEKLNYTINRITARNNEGEKTGINVFDRISDKKTLSLSALTLFQEQMDQNLTAKLKLMSETDIAFEKIPPVITDSFVSEKRDLYLISISPLQNPWHEKYRQVLSRQVESVSPQATGMVYISDVLTLMTQVDGVRSTFTALFIVLCILIIDFRNIKLAVMTVMPLLLSFSTLFAIMAATGLKFDFVNIISVPLLIGIGIDDAIHINHRYRFFGPGEMVETISKTGSAVLLTSLTTMIGFASFIPSPMRGLSGTGIVLAVAIALAFIYSIVFYPALLILAKEKLKLNISPWKSLDRKGKEE